MPAVLRGPGPPSRTFTSPNADGSGNGVPVGYGDYFGDTGMECTPEPHGAFGVCHFVTYICIVAFLILNLFIGSKFAAIAAATQWARH